MVALRVQAATVEWGKRGARINCISPGIISTPLAQDEMSGPGGDGFRQISPSCIAYAEDAIWMAGLRGERLWRIPLDGSKVAGEPSVALEGSYGRLRTVMAAGGDRLWLATSNTDGKGSPEGGDDRILLLQVS